ncbi:hypothetical protein [Cyanobium sp. Morenito 9A2]|uniref:hypothetical protein n=1 Tax=Cyanobium sp. Morenito 9A2 TaxID=2823718 RepID=UPI0020CC06D2|nr:hypothetical protein [Cyanobium sp. Morenito 9A2]MCP9849365.1 hypothetical protein [Cyanobium sp. Morenito 9A2]
MGEGLEQELVALRVEIMELRQVLAALLKVLTAEGGSLATASLAGQLGQALPTDATATLLAHRRGQRLNEEVLRRTVAGIDPEGDTTVDLLIDRLHDLVDPL